MPVTVLVKVGLYLEAFDANAVSTSVCVYVVDWRAFDANAVATSAFVYVVDWCG